jgi:hypothetical protein
MSILDFVVVGEFRMLQNKRFSQNALCNPNEPIIFGLSRI